jgi:hypothetical protein
MLDSEAATVCALDMRDRGFCYVLVRDADLEAATRYIASVGPGFQQRGDLAVSTLIQDPELE